MTNYKINLIGAILAAVLILFLLGGANVVSAQSAIESSVNPILSSPYTSWFSIVIAGALLILAVVALVYVLAPLIGRSDLRAWARIQFYSILFSILLIVIFEAFGALLYTTNPTNALKSIGVVPDFPFVSCASSSNLFELALCDIYLFNQYAVGAANYYTFVVGLRLAILPSLLVTVTPLAGVSNLGISLTIPFSPLDFPIGGVINALATMYTLNQLQLILIAASPLIFAVFISIGLIARIFGITRSFGGAMIAFALGIGFVYPLMTAITYGFIDTVVTNPATITLLSAFITSIVAISFIASFLPAILLAGALAGAAIASAIAALLSPFIIAYFGLLGVGLLFVPLMNFVIVDTFIVDFSQAVGERMDFMSLLTGLI